MHKPVGGFFRRWEPTSFICWEYEADRLRGLGSEKKRRLIVKTKGHRPKHNTTVRLARCGNIPLGYIQSIETSLVKKRGMAKSKPEE